MKIKISSLGCRLNQSEIQSVITVLKTNGHTITAGNDADIYIVNSCVVTQTSERKTRKLLHRAVRAIGEDIHTKKVIVTGCFADTVKEEENVIYVTNDYKYMIPQIIENWGTLETLSLDNISRFDYEIPLKAATTRINLKIQDGCDNFCSYCVIPFVRGTPQSKSFKDIMKEFHALLHGGYKEFLLTGVMIGKYNSEGKNFRDLISLMLSVDGDYRLHLSSLNPTMIDDGIVDLLMDPKMVHHLHLSLQSGSNSVLRRMNRHYSREDYLDITERIKRKNELFNFTTDLIVGFPGETEDEFKQTIELIKEVNFSHVHTFRYSPRPETEAAAMDNKIPENTKSERSQIVIDLNKKQKLNYYSKFNNKESSFLSEQAKQGKTTGFNEYYIPVQIDEILPRNEFYTIKTELDYKKFQLIGIVSK